MIRSLNTFLIIGAVAIAGTISATSSLAQSNDEMIFDGNVPVQNACFIFVRQDGTYATGVNGNELSSKLPGGQSGIVDVLAIFPYEIFVDAPTSFINRPVGGDNNVTHNSYFSGTALNNRGLTFPERSGSNPIRFPSWFGATRLNIDLDAVRPDSFPSGQYSSTATVRCE